MASVEDLSKLKRGELEQFAKENGIENPDNTENYPNIQSLAESVAPIVTPEMLEKFRVETLGKQPTTTTTDDQNGDGEDEGDGSDVQSTTTNDPALGNDVTQPTPANVSAPVTPSAPQHDPATSPSEDDAEVEGEIEEGDRVSYPYKDAGNGRHTGRVVQLDGQMAYVRYVDGSTRGFGLSQLQLVAKG